MQLVEPVRSGERRWRLVRIERISADNDQRRQLGQKRRGFIEQSNVFAGVVHGKGRLQRQLDFGFAAAAAGVPGGRRGRLRLALL